MNSNELVTVARLADHYEGHLADGHDPLEVATHDFNKLKRDSPRLLGLLVDSDRSDRSIGDWLYDFFVRHKGSGMSLRNFAEDESDRLEAMHSSKKKSPAQLQREIDEVLAAPSGETLLPGSANLWKSALEVPAARGHRLSRWNKEDKAALRRTLEYVRRSYKTPGASFPRLVPYGRELTCGAHHVARFSAFEIANAAETIARQAAERCGLIV